MALSVSFVCRKNLCVCSLGYIVGASPPCENMCVRSLGYIVGASPPSVNIYMCVHLLGYIMGASPPCVCPFIGRQSSLDPCMLPTPLCGIFFYIQDSEKWEETVWSWSSVSDHTVLIKTSQSEINFTFPSGYWNKNLLRGHQRNLAVLSW